ncbi:hypothetical protein FBEOM_3979 [Fusarium beomiforme]|uniref:NACHT-NTPase and P-loop NTPases N-terminal domain-containing protein n=1 Tax=Fusarium beomiforme TaxID=44412 RepID=A0A9P5ANL5_9HYPO|nr:hypothetical protein FBEOM_3979 [Fusarium beomiforme]
MSIKPSYVAMSLEDAICSVSRAMKTSCLIDESTEVPKAFTVVKNRLPLVLDILTSIKTKFTEHAEVHLQLQKMADECHPFGRQLYLLLETATPDPDEKRSFIERYRTVVNDSDRIECVMKKMLMCLEAVVKVPLIDEDQWNELKAALKELKTTPASIENTLSGYIFNNYSTGIQPIHLGEGHLSINPGNGPQIITPSGGTFHFTPSVMT